MPDLGHRRLDHRRPDRRRPVGALVGGRTARGCLPNIVVGIIGGIVGGWLAQADGLRPDERAHRRDRRRHPRVHRRATRSSNAMDSAVTGLTRRPPLRPSPCRPRPTRPYSPGLEGVIAGETSLSYVDGANGPAAVPRLPDRRPRRARHVSGGREPAVDWRMGCRPPPPDRAGAGARDGRPSSDAVRCQADGCAAHGRLGLGRDAGAALATDRRPGARPDSLLAIRARGLREAPIRQGSDRPGSRRSTSPLGSCTSSPGSDRRTARSGRSTRTSSSAPNTVSTRRPSRPASSRRRDRMSPPPWPARSAR